MSTRPLGLCGYHQRPAAAALSGALFGSAAVWGLVAARIFELILVPSQTALFHPFVVSSFNIRNILKEIKIIFMRFSEIIFRHINGFLQHHLERIKFMLISSPFFPGIRTCWPPSSFNWMPWSCRTFLWEKAALHFELFFFFPGCLNSLIVYCPFFLWLDLLFLILALQKWSFWCHGEALAPDRPARWPDDFSPTQRRREGDQKRSPEDGNNIGFFVGLRNMESKHTTI